MFYNIYFVSDLLTVIQEALCEANYYRSLIEWEFRKLWSRTLPGVRVEGEYRCESLQQAINSKVGHEGHLICMV